MEILGFTIQDRIEFARSAFSSTSGDMLTQFLDYCSGNPTIMSMMYIPLNCAIITQVYINCRGDNHLVPKTMTQLYTALCRSLIRRYMKQKGFRNKRIPDNFKDLPPKVLDPFSCLARIAFEKLKHNELVFSLPDNDDFDHMGFMNASVEIYVQTGVHHSYNFLHLNIQEYLAAWHICQMGDNCKIRETLYLEHGCMYQLNIFEEHMEGDYDDKIVIFENSFLQNVLVFIYGFLGSTLKEDLRFYNELCQIGGFCEWSDFNKHQFGFDTHKEVWQLIQCLFEAQSPQLCNEVLNDPKQELQVEITSPVNCHMFSYCYVNGNAQWHVRFISTEHLQLLDRCLTHWNQRNIQGTIKSMAIKDQWHEEYLTMLETLPKMEYFSELYLNDCNLTSANCEKLVASIHTYPNLKVLDISDNVLICSGGCVSLFAVLCNLQKLEKLCVTNCNLGLEDANCLNHFSSLHQHSINFQLETMHISVTVLSSVGNHLTL